MTNTSTPCPGSTAPRTQAFQRLKPCIAPGTHNFTVHHPPAGQWGYTQVICTRCGMSRAEARA